MVRIVIGVVMMGTVVIRLIRIITKRVMKVFTISQGYKKIGTTVPTVLSKV